MNKIPYNVRTTTVREYAGGSSVGGILRKTGTSHSSTNSSGQTNNPNAGSDGRQIELLVFGYACKVFRDDDKARDIDQGKHLIPWMGDANLKIDRYDVRGALCDLGPHEAPPGGYGNRLDYLTAEEQRAEQLCEEERYLYLYNNEEEHILQQEEDLKRLKQESEGGNFSQVGFRYGVGADPTTALTAGTEGAVDVADETEQPFVLPANLVVPAHLQLPKTMKQHAIIEKTARFIASQGVQMEILLKAKQSNNVQFEFLTQNSTLNAYYKNLVEVIKQGKYPAESCQVDQLLEPNKPSTETESASEVNGASISTVCVSSKKPVITVPTIKYKPSANCSYTQLISKIRGVPLQTVIDEDCNSNNSGLNSPTSIKSSNSGEFTPVLLQYNGSTFAHAEDGDVSNTGSLSNGGNIDANNGDSGDGVAKVEVFKNTSALALAQNYCSDSDESDNDEVDVPVEPALDFPIPEDNLRHIIDKTATYVIKNGRQFEETLRAKSVERFTFLLPDNEYYPYYMYKITDDPNAASKEQKTRKAAAVAAALLSKKGLTAGAAAIDKQMTPVSFSIKTKDEHPTLQPALPQEPSDDETEQEAEANANANGTMSNVDRQVPERVQKAIQLVEAQLLARNGVTTPQLPETHSPENCRQKEIKKAEEKFKDKLAQIAREKLGGLISKEKQLQLERKRKAMAFLNQIKSGEGSTAKVQTAIVSGAEETTSSTGVTQATDGTEQTAESLKTNNKDDESDASSVRSIPITSYGPEDDDDDEPEEPQNEHTNNKEHVQVAQVTLSTAKAPTVLLSDDDDVQLVGETSPPLAGITSLSTYAKRALENRNSVKYAAIERQIKRIEGDSARHHSRHKAKKTHKDKQAERKRRQHRRSTHKRARSRSRSTSKDTDSDSDTSSNVSSTSTDGLSSDSEASTLALCKRSKKSSRTRHKSSSTKKSDTHLPKNRRARSRSRGEIRRSHKKSSRYDVVAEQEEALAYMRQREKNRERERDRASTATSKKKYHQSSDWHHTSRSRSRSTTSQASKRSKRSSSRYVR